MHEYLITHRFDGEVYLTVIRAYDLDDAWSMAPERKHVRSIIRVVSGK